MGDPTFNFKKSQAQAGFFFSLENNKTRITLG